MRENISLFSGYSQGENRTTNYCLLVLKLLYEENPKIFSEALSRIVGEESIGSHIGVSFYQQQKRPSGTPDALIQQAPITIYIETKHWDWFYDAQLEKHLQDLNKEQEGLKVLLALGNFESITEDRFRHIEKLCKKKYKGRIAFAKVGFEEFLEAVKLDAIPKDLRDLLSDFELYLDQENLLPRWKNLLDVVNCARWPEEIIDGNTYMCPTTGGSYSHARCKYFGMYSKKAVSNVAEIEAVVDLQGKEESAIRWKNVEQSDSEVIRRARETLGQWRPGNFPTRVFVLGEVFPTDFKKDTPGSMWGTKRYFDVGHLKPSGARDLAEMLKKKSWSEIERR